MEDTKNISDEFMEQFSILLAEEFEKQGVEFMQDPTFADEHDFYELVDQIQEYMNKVDAENKRRKLTEMAEAI